MVMVAIAVVGVPTMAFLVRMALLSRTGEIGESVSLPSIVALKNGE